jgi:hypothetical protein
MKIQRSDRPFLSDAQVEETVLACIRLALRRKISDDVMQKIRCEARHDPEVGLWVIEMVGDFIGAQDRDPVIISHYHEPKTWWDALRRAWSQWVAPSTAVGWRGWLRLSYRRRILPKLYQELRVCPHAPPFNNRHVQWVQMKRPPEELQI